MLLEWVESSDRPVESTVILLKFGQIEIVNIMNKDQLKRKRNRIKLTCLVCKQTFDDDYGQKHNKKYHGDLLKEGKRIGYETVGAPANPFVLAEKQKK